MNTVKKEASVDEHASLKAEILSCMNGCLPSGLWEKKRTLTWERSSGTDIHGNVLIALSVTSAWGGSEHKGPSEPSRLRNLALGFPVTRDLPGVSSAGSCLRLVWGITKTPGLWVSPGASPTRSHTHTCRVRAAEKQSRRGGTAWVPT